MSADVLRRAAALMRERAEAATQSPWEAVEGSSGAWWVELPSLADVAIDLHGENARHIASWHPAVALAVADWLASEAAMCEEFLIDEDETPQALAVARAYIGEQP